MQLMSISHVSGGFYLQVDASLTRAVAVELGLDDWGPNTGSGKDSPFYMDLRLTCSHGSRFKQDHVRSFAAPVTTSAYFYNK